MPFLEMPLGDTVIHTAVPAGAYALRITEWNFHKKGHKKDDGLVSPQEATSIRVIIGLPETPEANSVFHYLALPSADDDGDKRNFKQEQILKFLELFGIPYDDNGFNPEDFNGAEAVGWLSVEEHEGNEANKLTFKSTS